MPGPSTTPKAVVAPDATLTSIRLKPGELVKLRKSINWVQLPDGSIETMVGPAPLEPDQGQGYPVIGYPHGIFHARLANGMSPTLLLRAGTQLYVKEGRTWRSVKSGLSNEQRACYPDTFCLVNDKIIWCNGIDAPVVVDAWHEVYGLGFSATPSTPVAIGPELSASSTSTYQNTQRSWPGGKGTPGDVLDGQRGLLLAGIWRYKRVYEDYFGNLSPASLFSNPAVIEQITAEPFYANAADEDAHRGEMDQLTRQFHATAVAAPSGLNDRIAIQHLAVTLDMGSGRNDSTTYLVDSVGGRGAMSIPDDTPDGLLSVVTEELAPVEPYRVACVHNGILTVGNLSSNPLKIQEASPGFPGTWPKRATVTLSSGGGELTGLVSHSGRRIAFTRNSIFDVTDFSPGMQHTIAQGIGCCSPGSLKATPDGLLIWLSDSGFYAMGADMYPRAISGVELLDDVRKRLNFGFAIKAAGCFDPSNREYLCAVAPAGQSKNTVIWRWNGVGFRQYEFDWSVAAMCVTDDERQYVLIAGSDENANQNHVAVLNHEVPTYEAPPRMAVMRTQMIRPPEVTTMFRIRDIQVEIFDATNDDCIRVYGYKNDSWAVDVGPIAMTAINPPRETDVIEDVVGSAVIGTAKLRSARALWRYATLDMHDCASFAIEIQVDYPNYARIGSVIVTAEPVSTGAPIGRMANNTEV